MTKHLLAWVAVGALAAGILSVAGHAEAAPSGPSDAEGTIKSLTADGYNVLLNRVGNAPMSQCAVTAIRPGRQVSRTDSGFPGDTRSTVVVSKTIHVDLRC